MRNFIFAAAITMSATFIGFYAGKDIGKQQAINEHYGHVEDTAQYKACVATIARVGTMNTEYRKKLEERHK